MKGEEGKDFFYRIQKSSDVFLPYRESSFHSFHVATPWCVKPKFLHIVPPRYLHSNCQTTFSQGWEHVTNNDEIKHDNARLQKDFFLAGVDVTLLLFCYRLGKNGEAMLKRYYQDIFQFLTGCCIEECSNRSC